jgi:hypothetical protein
MFCASAVFPAGIDDFDYLATQHAPLFARLLGDACQRLEVRRRLTSQGAPPSPVLGAAYFWVTSGEFMGAAPVEYGEAVCGDVARFSPEQPVRGWSEVV